MTIQIAGCEVLIDDEDYINVVNIKWRVWPKRRSVNGEGYFFYIKTENRTSRKIYLHRAIMGLDKYTGIEVDHINGDILDNRKINLRICEHKYNSWNRKISSMNTTGFKGVSAVGNKYRARIRKDGVFISLGYYQSPELAHEAYCNAAVKLFGEYARF